ncbi:hypothetical protein JAAARDRAFT_433844 [Jaapia argillacea MUCL 33604]|uniref:Uncharacterized protein n=1 Tax=Jaapia argillacea MUCL 33604 TaxID=933084 RepID=A0A067PPZ4_9AGAM|nr:hypothetical protein JAAARDRAFT_433844 [Jaapia argillacea MUCL 33604]
MSARNNLALNQISTPDSPHPPRICLPLYSPAEHTTLDLIVLDAELPSTKWCVDRDGPRILRSIVRSASLLNQDLADRVRGPERANQLLKNHPEFEELLRRCYEGGVFAEVREHPLLRPEGEGTSKHLESSCDAKTDHSQFVGGPKRIQVGAPCWRRMFILYPWPVNELATTECRIEDRVFVCSIRYFL